MIPPLCHSFPSLFAISSSKKAWVRDIWRDAGDGGHWDPIFFRNLNDWEVEEVVGLFLRLGSKKLFMEIDDKPRWEEMKNGDFSTRAL